MVESVLKGQLHPGDLQHVDSSMHDLFEYRLGSGEAPLIGDRSWALLD